MSCWVGTMVGCVAIPRPSKCQCDHCCSTSPGPADVFADLSRTFDHLVMGVDFEADLQANSPSQAELLPSTLPDPQVRHLRTYDAQSPYSDLEEYAETRPAVAPPVPSSKLLAEGMVDYGPTSGLSPALPPQCGPPPRFFPVPARPVFSASTPEFYPR